MSVRDRAEAPPNAAMLAACGVAIATLVPVALHQLGALEHLPDPPGDVFDSDAITESKAAHPFGLPDGLLGLASYGTTFALMLLAYESRTARKLMARKLAADGSAAAFNVVRQVVQFRKLCSWCTGTAAATAVMLLASRSHVMSKELPLKLISQVTLLARPHNLLCAERREQRPLGR